MKLLGGGGGGGGGVRLVCGRPTLALSSALVHKTKQLQRKHHATKQEPFKNTKHLFLLIFYFFYSNYKTIENQET